MKHVERAVRPVVAPWKQKMQMRADLLARLTALYEQEFARLGDAQAAVLQAMQRVGSAVQLSSQLQRSVPRRTYWQWKIGQTLFGRPEDPPFSRAARWAAAVVLILLLACAVRPLDEQRVSDVRLQPRHACAARHRLNLFVSPRPFHFLPIFRLSLTCLKNTLEAKCAQLSEYTSMMAR